MAAGDHIIRISHFRRDCYLEMGGNLVWKDQKVVTFRLDTKKYKRNYIRVKRKLSTTRNPQPTYIVGRYAGGSKTLW